MADAVNQLYVVLEEMVRCAQKGDMKAVLRLNRAYEKLNPRELYRCMTEEVAGEYDNCRQSCTMIGILPLPRERMLEDAKDRFARIPKPE